MKKLALFMSLTFVSVSARAGWMNTIIALDADNKAEAAKAAAEGTKSQVVVLQKEIEELKAIVLKMAEGMDKKDAPKKKKAIGSIKP